jgi:hypothetical protein
MKGDGNAAGGERTELPDSPTSGFNLTSACIVKLSDKAVAMPKLDVVGFNVLLCNFDRGGIVRTFKFDAAQNIAVGVPTT